MSAHEYHCNQSDIEDTARKRTCFRSAGPSHDARFALSSHQSSTGSKAGQCTAEERLGMDRSMT